ncbi:MAG: FAD-dependent oxidoreductase [Flavobacteriales bacterium]|nr:NAD(P)/FAD-dependent oxidoreductase [Bacteroidales bacterium AH-315-I05]PCJ88791.1 MAG: FAD-dependent oxidoreductase [Flavobacteriales bacterium]
MKVGESFKRVEISETYDAIIIGSGIGGLGTAALLSKEGKKVLVLEKHYVAGGFTHVFKRKEYEWDVGVHYVGEVHREHSLLKHVFVYVTNGQLQWAEMDDVYDRIIFPDKEYDFVKGRENFTAKLKEYFPDESKTIDNYVETVCKAARTTSAFYGERTMPKWLSAIFGRLMRRGFLKYSNKTTLQALQEMTSNEKLIGVLTGQFGDYGLPPAQSSFAMHCVLVKHYMGGSAYPVGGCERIAQTIAPVIEKAGGKIYVNAGVEKIIVKKNKAIGVKMGNGVEIFAKNIISNAGVLNTYNHLLNGEVTEKFKLKNQLEKVEPATSHISLYIGLKHTAEELNLGNTNLWIYPSYEHDKNVEEFLGNPDAPLPVTYISFPSAKDPDWENRYPGRATIEILTVAPYEWFEKWENTKWKKRGKDYEAFKEKLSLRLLEQLYKHKPQVKGKIDYYELSTPLSTKHFANYQKGEIYGLNHDPERFRQKFLRVNTPIKNLFLTGQDIVSVGVGGALMAGVLTASVILQKNLLGKIRKKAKEIESAR